MTAEELEKQLQKDLQVVRQYLEIKHRNNGRLPVTMQLDRQHENRNRSHEIGAPYGKIGPAVLDAIKRCRKTYNVRDIHKLLKGQNISKGQIATALRRFESQGKIKEVEHGSGRRPNKYETFLL